MLAADHHCSKVLVLTSSAKEAIHYALLGTALLILHHFDKLNEALSCQMNLSKPKQQVKAELAEPYCDPN